jgi:hypothetical protein
MGEAKAKKDRANPRPAFAVMKLFSSVRVGDRRLKLKKGHYVIHVFLSKEEAERMAKGKIELLEFDLNNI